MFQVQGELPLAELFQYTPSIYWTTSLLSANAVTFLLTTQLIRMLEQAKTTLEWVSSSTACARLRNKRFLCYRGWCYHSMQCRKGIYRCHRVWNAEGGVGGCGTHVQRHKLQSNSGLPIHSPLEKEPLTDLENSCQATWERKEIHRIVFFCTKEGMHSKKEIWKGRGKKKPSNAKQKTLT